MSAGNSFLPSILFQEHLTECEHRPQECNNRAKGCRYLGTEKELAKHQAECEYAQASCEFCDKEMMRRHLEVRGMKGHELFSSDSLIWALVYSIKQNVVFG